MFVPIGDENPLRHIRFQYVTITLIALNVAAYLLEMAPVVTQEALTGLAIVPRELFAAGLFGGGPGLVQEGSIPERFTLLSYMFLHGDPMHLLGNMLFLWVFGDNVEDSMGHLRFLIFYLACGVIAGLFHALLMPDSRDALIGASGAISGVIAAYLMLHPRVSVWVLAFKFFPLRITAGLALGLWVVFQLVMAFVPQAGPTAWWAHVGGLIAGAALIPLFKRSGVPILGR